jgi:hypothetical protein
MWDWMSLVRIFWKSRAALMPWAARHQERRGCANSHSGQKIDLRPLAIAWPQSHEGV